ncbi:MAG: radical SAM protein [Myxococcales bacterium]|nr:radical SAM protein [Myxococcales bacterium]
MSRRCILVALDWTRPGDPRIPLGHASLSAMLRSRGIDVAEVCLPANHSSTSPALVVRAILDRVDRSESDVDVAIGAYVWNEPLVTALLPRLRAVFSGRIILGGPQVTYATNELAQLYPGVDLFVRGYAETALASIVGDPRAPLPKGVTRPHEPSREPASGDLAELPSPYSTGALPLDFAPGERRLVRWETQRGCPYRCAFCQHRDPSPEFTRIQRALADRLADEARRFVAAGAEQIAVLDPIFNLGAPAVRTLNLLRSVGFGGHLSLQCRFEALTDDFLDALAGFDVCLEFGLQTIHDAEAHAVDRRNRIDVVEAAIERLHRRRIPYLVSLIYGLPLQTSSSFRSSVQFCLDRAVPSIRAFPLMLLRGTPLELRRHEWSLRENDDLIPAVIQSSTFTTAEWLAMSDLAAALRFSEGRHPLRVEELE